MISPKRALEIASYWHGPSPMDSEITRFSHRGEIIDRELFIEQLEYNKSHFASSPDSKVEIDELIEFVNSFADSEV